uniref:ZP domain-containing protein n=1 Tax=Panagrellus redivivus TaxID=6233 RepID=A0A7E4W087_PANRE
MEVRHMMKRTRMCNEIASCSTSGPNVQRFASQATMYSNKSLVLWFVPLGNVCVHFECEIHRERYVGDRPMRADGNRDMSDRRSSTYREQGHHRIQTTNFSSFTTRLRSTKWTPDAKANGVRFVFQSSMSRISKTCGTSVDQLMPVLHFTLHP